MDEKGILLDDMYNMDETGFQIGVGKNQWIVTIDPSRQSYLASSNNRDYITIIEEIQGLGEVLPPMVILAATQFLGRWFNNNDIEDNTLSAVLETGYSNDELSLDWVKHFDKYSLASGCFSLTDIVPSAHMNSSTIVKIGTLLMTGLGLPSLGRPLATY